MIIVADDGSLYYAVFAAPNTFSTFATQPIAVTEWGATPPDDVELALKTCAALCTLQNGAGFTITLTQCSVYADLGSVEGVTQADPDTANVYSVVNCDRVLAANESDFVETCEIAKRCAGITCAELCDYGLSSSQRQCGWFQNRCLPGERTKKGELGQGTNCPTTTSSATSILSTTTTTTTDPCPPITCGRDCIGICGWNPETYKCEKGGTTSLEDMKSGDCSVRSCAQDPDTAFELVTNEAGTASVWFDTSPEYVLDHVDTLMTGPECAVQCIAKGDDCRGFEIQVCFKYSCLNHFVNLHSDSLIYLASWI